MRWVIVFLFMARAVSADMLAYSFEWQGGGGYTLQGTMTVAPPRGPTGLIYETDVACFEIAGFRDGLQVGRWALGMLTPETTWTLTFDPQALGFLVYSPETPMPQAWNMDGAGYNCGDPGFGFNIGSAAQDLCIDGELIFASQVPPPVPFPVIAEPDPKLSRDACRPEVLLSLLPAPAEP